MKKLEVKQMEAVQGGYDPWWMGVVCFALYHRGTNANTQFEMDHILTDYMNYCVG